MFLQVWVYYLWSLQVLCNHLAGNRSVVWPLTCLLAVALALRSPVEACQLSASCLCPTRGHIHCIFVLGYTVTIYGARHGDAEGAGVVGWSIAVATTAASLHLIIVLPCLSQLPVPERYIYIYSLTQFGQRARKRRAWSCIEFGIVWRS